MIQAESGAYPAGGSVRLDADSHTGSVVAPPDGVTFPITTSSYYEPSGSGSVNFIYCTGPSVESGAPVFNVAARSKSGDSFRYNFTKGLELISVVAVSVACDGIDLSRSMSYGYFSNSGGWQDWVL